VRSITEIIIHCSATPPSLDVGAKEIDRWHRSQGWLKIGYHFVIRRNGAVENGRPIEQIGAHAEGHNANSIGICMVGGVVAGDSGLPDNNFTGDQWHTLTELVGKLRSQFPNANIIGHREVAKHPKACPSFDVQDWKKHVGF